MHPRWTRGYRQQTDEAASAAGVHPSILIGQIQRSTGDWFWQRRQTPRVWELLDSAGLME